ncbi:hypothetical protein MHZ92_00415 [Sporosarcina sp. ACRSL]|uniref:hypothetical protein n=1 Tax=Sporosarcina sp. ACRSL TaxID=2918215 RepID=UPI001EF430C2|nr:hypothetical protein [Sporosarcina sp. ACRSL]MCG7342571.1 hypothetical protein [Sporosarcina sp. ACRSL]
MRKFAGVLFLSCLILLAGCNSISKYDDEDVAAIVRGEEITVGELRFLYPDDKILDSLDGMIKAKLVEQEVMRMKLDVSEKLQEVQASESSIRDFYPPEDDDSETAKNIRNLNESQAKKLGMEPSEYFVKHTLAYRESGVYLLAYVDKMIGEPMLYDEDFDINEYNAKGNQVLDQLVEENKDEIEIFIK